jgi:hypothetical protein
MAQRRQVAASLTHETAAQRQDHDSVLDRVDHLARHTLAQEGVHAPLAGVEP